MPVLRWLLLAVLLLSLPVAAQDATVQLSPGEQKVLDFPSIRRIAVASPEVADVKVIGKKQLLVIAQRRGRTSLTVWTDKQQVLRTIVVDQPRAEDLSRELRDLGFTDLDIRTVGDNIVVDGRVDSLNDLKRLRSVVAGRSDVKLLVRADARVIQAALANVAEQINTAFKRNGIVSARAVVVGQRILLEGSVTDDVEREKAQRIADSFYDELKGSLSTQ
jgi:Flp pilus assembly secretin CpaC